MQEAGNKSWERFHTVYKSDAVELMQNIDE
jgi:hypothetical protein